ncbi:MAG: ubiquinone/menaquinone biosynthesis methyltransferase [Verrucomicrobiales bacterium]|nr:ubiquinone/menaquinone biosynthesis methyltransferase [Verrucomicrobiales bacterium]
MNRVSEALSSPDSKRELNRMLFDRIAKKYDRATVLLSCGQDQSWKNSLIEALPDTSPAVCLDLASGTGDITKRLTEKYPDSQVIGLDLSEEMVSLARKRFQDSQENLSFQVGDIGKLPFPDNSIDIVTGGYALRNVPQLQVALDEIARVMKPGATASFLDFLQPENRFLKLWNHAVLHLWCGIVGLILHGRPWIYRYIPYSLSDFPDTPTLNRMFEASGFYVGPGKVHFGGFLQRIEVNKVKTS